MAGQWIKANNPTRLMNLLPDNAMTRKIHTATSLEFVAYYETAKSPSVFLEDTGFFPTT